LRLHGCSDYIQRRDHSEAKFVALSQYRQSTPTGSQSPQSAARTSSTAIRLGRRRTRIFGSRTADMMGASRNRPYNLSSLEGSYISGFLFAPFPRWNRIGVNP
jgi:hypothetical protein